MFTYPTTFSIKKIKITFGLNHKDAHRWFYNGWQCLYYSASSSLSLYIYSTNIHDGPGDYLKFYAEKILPNLNQFDHGPFEYFLIMSSLGYYADASYWLITDSKMLFRQQDTLILLAHHSITITSILLIYMNG